MSNDAPSPSGDNGHGPDGRFTPGNNASRGNPHAAHVARLRTALLHAVAPDDMRAIAAKLIEQAKAGDIAAVRELLARLLGPPVAADFLERLERLEQNHEPWRE